MVSLIIPLAEDFQKGESITSLIEKYGYSRNILNREIVLKIGKKSFDRILYEKKKERANENRKNISKKTLSVFSITLNCLSTPCIGYIFK